MLKNYLTLALKVLRRKPFYTFISLFGISFTLMILLLLTAMMESIMGDNRPMSDRDRLVVAPTLRRLRVETDTSLVIDTVAMDNGTLRYDTTERYLDRTTSNSNNPMSYFFADEYLRDFEEAENYTFVHTSSHVDGYLEGRKFSFAPYLVTASYWEVFDFEFLHGEPFNATAERDAEAVVVLTDRAANDYFGRADASVIGREMILGADTYTVKGIVARPLSDSPIFSADVMMPITRMDPRELTGRDLYGGVMAIFVARTPERIPALKEEIRLFAENFQMPAEEFHNEIELGASTYVEGIAQFMLQENDPEKALRRLFIPLTILLLLFMALPLLNLVNLNIGRVQERRSEIAVRKAFGARSGDILAQFILENIVLTLIGGVIGLGLGLLAIRYVNANDLLGITRLASNGTVFLYFFLLILLFGFLSGILPAYRMSRTNVATALRGSGQ